MKLNITLAPKFMCIDASKAMAFAINKVFPLCIVLMCWFHLKYNVLNLKYSIKFYNQRFYFRLESENIKLAQNIIK
jgi:hypothetical protein